MLLQPRQQHAILYKNQLLLLCWGDCCVMQECFKAVIGGAHPYGCVLQGEEAPGMGQGLEEGLH